MEKADGLHAWNTNFYQLIYFTQATAQLLLLDTTYLFVNMAKATYEAKQ